MPPASNTESDSQYGTTSGHLKPPERLLAHNNSVNALDNALYDWKSGSTNQQPPPWFATSGQQSLSSHQLTRLTPNPRYQNPHSGYDACASKTHGQSTQKYPASVSDTSRPLRLIAPSIHIPAPTISSSDLVQISSETAILHQKTTGDLSKSIVRCDQCDSRFTGKYGPGNLTRHIKATHKRETRRCEVCKKTFRRSDAKRKHERRFHSGRIDQLVPGNQNGQSPTDSVQPLNATKIPPVEPENSTQNSGHMYDEHPQLALVHTYSVCDTSNLSDSQDLDTASFNFSFTSPTELSSISQDPDFPSHASSNDTAPENSHSQYFDESISFVSHLSLHKTREVPQDADFSILYLGSQWQHPVQSDLAEYEFNHSSNQDD
jgi:hypothetical protein